MSQGGPPSGFNPNSVGALNTTPDPNKHIMGLLYDGPGMAQYDTQGFLKGNIGGMNLISSRNTGWKGKLEAGLGIRTTAKITGFEDVQGAPVDTSSDAGSATYDQVFGAAQTIYQNGSGMTGFSAHENLGQMAAPPTPSVNRGRGGLGV